MAITITQKPFKYAPTQNPIIFRFYTNNPNTVYFIVKVLDNTGKLLSKNKVFIPPDGKRTNFIDLSMILDNYVVTEVDNDNELLVNLSGTVSYTVNVTGVDITGRVTDIQVDSDVYYAFNSKYNAFDVYNDAINSYYMVTGRQSDFLSDKHTRSSLHILQREFLYFLADNASSVGSVKIKMTYKGGDTINKTIEFNNPSNRLIHRLNLTPQVLATQLGLSLVRLRNITVWLESKTGMRMSTERVYDVCAYGCGVDLVNLIWVNKLGGMTSHTFINPREVKSSDKTNLDTNGYLDLNKRTYKPLIKTIDNKILNTYTMTTTRLSDYDFRVLSEIIFSKEVYIELTDGNLYPVQLKTDRIDIMQKKYNRTLSRLELQFDADSNLTLDLFNKEGDGFDYDLDIIL